ncbi:CATRA system-associated protein [Streptomyces sp. NBC_01477]|uniref:CATRA system-associated protein n=1 Tax=Streptomyces sp. NBC_01477 TaxID=2976015 RepID=UPI002E31E9B2|nr:CATRA system-associated protein [Streptomyces sp. NBC_01477]
MSTGSFDTVRADALELLGVLADWRLAPARWDRVAEVLAAAAEAAAGRDAEALDAAVGELELAGPVRITRIGGTPTEPPPPAVRERANHLVHALGGAPAGPRPAPEDDPR